MPLLIALALSAIPLTPSELRWGLAGVAIGFILAASSKSAAHLGDALLLELRRWSSGESGRAQDDDITLLVLEVQCATR